MPSTRTPLWTHPGRTPVLVLVGLVVALVALGSARLVGAEEADNPITDLQIAAVAPDWVVLTWNSDPATGARVTLVDSGRVLESPLTGTHHRIDLTGLECGTDHQLEISGPPGSPDGGGTTPLSLRVTTAPCPTPGVSWRVDPTRPIPLPAPVISEPAAAATGSSGAEVSWLVDRFSGASVVLTDGSGVERVFSAPPGTGSMVVAAEGLDCSTTYAVTIRANGPTGVESRAETEVTTASCPTPDPVDISVSPGLDRLDISWSTSLPTLAQVSWGPDPLADSLLAVTEPELSHAVSLEGLDCGTTYWVRVAAIAADGSGIGWSPEMVATTVDCVGDTGGPDSPALTLVGLGTRVGPDRVDMVWTTDLMSTAIVEIGPVDAEPDLVLESGPAVDHSVGAEGLECGTTYSYRILARVEGAGGPADPPDVVRSGEFTTAACDGVETTIDALTVQAERDRALLVFDTPQPATAFVQWGLTDLYDFSVETSELVTHHEIPLEGLTCGTLYHFDIEALDAGPDMPAITGDLTFSTLPCEDQGGPDPGAVPALS